MPTAAITITRGIPGAISSVAGRVWLSQEPPKVHRPSALDLAAGLSKMLTGGAGPDGDCGFAPGGHGYGTTVYVSSTPPELEYDCGAAPGEIIKRVRSRREQGEILAFAMSDTATLTWPPLSIASIEWQGACYDADGNEVTPPTPVTFGEQIRIPYPVYGSLSIVYLVQIERCSVRIATGGHLGSHFWAAWNGGVEILQLEIPQSTVDASATGTCPDWDVDLDVTPDDQPKPPPKVKPEDRTVDIDYCTQEQKE